jgi:hypothetical protein
MKEPLSEEYIATALQEARRYQGQWCGSIGNMAAHVVRLIRERERMLEANREREEIAAPLAAEAIAAWRRYQQSGPIERRIYGADGDQPQPAADGTTAKFGTGAVRSDTFEEFRYDLISPIGLREVARTCSEGAQKYSDFNWEKGMPVHDLLNHAIAHIYQFLSGDRGEPHLPHAAWNLLAAIHSAELWPQLNSGTLRESGCKAPGGA